MMYLQTFGILFLMLGLLFLFAYGLKKWGHLLNIPMLASVVQKKEGRRRLEVLSYVPLDGKYRLALVRKDESEFLISLHPTAGVRLLDKTSKPFEGLTSFEESTNGRSSVGE